MPDAGIGTVVITGASSGLGAALARSYAAPGARLGLIGRDPARLAAVADLCRAQDAEVTAATLDVRDAPALTEWLLAVDGAAPIGLVIANAGTSAGTHADGTPEGLELATRQIGVNLLGAVNTVEPVLPAMRARGGGQIAVVASVAGYRGLPYSPAYSASKAGLRAYGEALRALLRPDGIDVTVVVPGFFESPMTDRFKGDHPFAIPLARAAAIVKAGIDRRKARVVFPRALAAGLRLTDLAPAFLGDAILRRFRFHIVPGA